MRFLFIFFLLAGSLFGQKEFINASKEFVRGNFVEAEKYLSSYLKENPEDGKAKQLYQRIAMELTRQNLNKGNDEEAHKWAKKAYQIDPSNTKARDLYLATRKLEKPKLEKQEVKIAPPKLKNLKITPPKTPKIKPPSVGLKKPKEKIKYREIYKTKEIVKEKEVFRIPSWVWLSFVLNLILAAGIFFVYSYRRKRKRLILEENIKRKLELASTLKREGDILIKELGKQRAKEIFYLLKLDEIPDDINIKIIEEGRAFTDINPVPRLIADAVELSEKFLDDRERLTFAMKYADYPNNRVRANVAKAIYKVKPQVALKILKEMSVSFDRWMRLSCVWACSQIKSRDAINILKKLADDGDVAVSLSAQKAFKEIESQNEKVKT
ncbi:MAG: HEAT repeat domain-containing protein [Elusimicrobia bacterium]|nr:HEAT repeat domain-containing protein [Elusimicrobiota bacterium]